MIGPRASCFLTFFIILFSASISNAQPQPSAVTDFYIYDGSYKHINRNDSPRGQTGWYIVSHPSNGALQPGDDGGLGYLVNPNFTFGVDWATYRYCEDTQQHNCGNTAPVVYLVLGGYNTQDLGWACELSPGEPVNASTGNMWLQHLDYSLPGFGEGLQINRFYNSQLQSTGLFGFGWTTKYDERLTLFKRYEYYSA